MIQWNLTDNIFKQILSRNDDPNNEEESVRDTVAELIPHLKRNHYWAGLPESTLMAVGEAKTFHSFNRALDAVYDYADSNRIWLGFKEQQ